MKKFRIIILFALIFTGVLFSCETKNDPAANPASDFEYTIDGNNVTITKFIGTVKKRTECSLFLRWTYRKCFYLFYGV